MGMCHQISDCLLDNFGVPQVTACDEAELQLPLAAGDAAVLPSLVHTLRPPRCWLHATDLFGDLFKRQIYG